MASIPRLLVVQRISLSHDKHMSRSISARFGPLLTYMSRHGMIKYEEIVESEVSVNHLRHFDAILFNKHTSNRAIDVMRLANDLGLRTIYDLDDWIIDLPTYSVTELNNDLLANIMWLLRNASVATISNQTIHDKLHRIRPDAIIITNGFDHELYPSKISNRVETDPPKIMLSNTDDIKLVHFKKEFFHVVADFMHCHPEVELDFWGDDFHEMSLIPRLNQKGYLENSDYKNAIHDAGYKFSIVPLGGREDPESLYFNSCKSCIKYIDYGSLGIPGLYSKSPVYENAILHRSTGLLVNNTPEEWANAMEELYLDSQLRDTLRRNAYADTLQRFGLATPSKVFFDLLTLQSQS